MMHAAMERSERVQLTAVAHTARGMTREREIRIFSFLLRDQLHDQRLSFINFDPNFILKIFTIISIILTVN